MFFHEGGHGRIKNQNDVYANYSLGIVGDYYLKIGIGRERRTNPLSDKFYNTNFHFPVLT